MAQWKTILCATDLSETSRRALGEAAGLAQHFGADLVLVHAHPPVNPSLVSVDLVGFSIDELTRREAQRLQPTLDQWKADAERLVGRPVETHLIAGDAAKGGE